MSEVLFLNRLAARGRLLRGVAAALVVLVSWLAHPAWAEPTSAAQAREVVEAGNRQGAEFNLKGKPSIKLPDTGITTCYCHSDENCSRDLWGWNSCPSPGERYYGQDANYRGWQPSYRNNGNGTVTDQVTGLMWQQADDGVTRPWVNAVGYCQDLELGGHTDWRLPSRKELLSIVDYGRRDPAINPVFSCSLERYWSGTTRALDSARAWRVWFNYGSSNFEFKGEWFYVRCVRGELVSFGPNVSGPLYLLLQVIE